ncbi:4-hydroxy-tetrahydrodipicolinate reductase [Silvibacterium sp.]|uniref:4-hydroxy-tetrahydrodipicolinate reductase n=1 Tax=Silvibacterium sp. TaxID=1964179 RepID=UPI0039E69B9B
MRLLVLGRGKTGRIVADIAHERGHSVRVLASDENRDASALTAPFLAQFDAVIDFTSPEAVVGNMRACLANGAHMVVGTTGWYGQLEDMRALAARKGAGFLYGTNYSVGVQATLKLAKELAKAIPHYRFSISETHHVSKKDAPSGTALTLKQALQTAVPGLEVEITSHREGDASGLHVIEARSENDVIELKHEAFSRRGFAEGAVRAAEWIHDKTGVWDFSEISSQLS